MKLNPEDLKAILADIAAGRPISPPTGSWSQRDALATTAVCHLLAAMCPDAKRENASIVHFAREYLGNDAAIAHVAGVLSSSVTAADEDGKRGFHGVKTLRGWRRR